MSTADAWRVLREATQARVGLGRAGDALPTAEILRLDAAHALARDAVHAPLDVEALVTDLRGATGLDVVRVASEAGDRTEYLQRPDLGRRLADGAELTAGEWDLAVVVADGLSARAVQAHAAGLLAALLARLEGWAVAPPVVATQARVALGDDVGSRLGAALVLVLIGERPGMSAPDSLGAYLTWGPRRGRADAERNCVSNVRPPHGLSYERAADVLAALLTESRRRQLSGVGLKDTGEALPPAD
ncbi:ethanolamine ammonia-lyase subunit EutC [Actinomycetospora sp. TBRC 11914]|uniref:ethanolamine ammonia-lyase subunit EutC n=1 Tax=Actinomycetospora sp. TBRC 11914 TaxID=2729387 RepID=UPI00145E7F6F|nr:ethanolamine ammonia-lyase subunit EutC [Actinomycetospora sp. TBRC 11914]NMO89615.1 ethanolamine ammonia-lyase subunit EutC [Actinomycetospora sp. TBRC 11914]